MRGRQPEGADDEVLVRVGAGAVGGAEALRLLLQEGGLGEEVEAGDQVVLVQLLQGQLVQGGLDAGLRGAGGGRGGAGGARVEEGGLAPRRTSGRATKTVNGRPSVRPDATRKSNVRHTCGQ